MWRLVPILLVLLAPTTALGQAESGPRVDVIEISGPVDDELASFVLDTIGDAAARDTEVVILQMDSRAVVAEADRYDELLSTVSDPPVPLAVWVGPAPAWALGGVAELVAAAPLSFAAPGVEIGTTHPVLATDPSVETTTRIDPTLAGRYIRVTDPVDGLIDEIAPTINHVVQALDGRTVSAAGAEAELTTLTEIEVDGQPMVTTVEVVLHEPGYWSRFLRLAVSPEAAFFFLILGLTVAAFEFYAIGPGLAAGAAGMALFLASYGMVTLPLRWWAVGLVLGGWWALTASYQMGSVAVLTSVGAVLLLIGGLAFTDGAGQIPMSLPVTVVIVFGVLIFYTMAMPTVARSRFSTRTIGREHMMGRTGVAMSDFDDVGEVEVDGARWRAAAHREAGIRRGDAVTIMEVDGPVLQVGPGLDSGQKEKA